MSSLKASWGMVKTFFCSDNITDAWPFKPLMNSILDSSNFIRAVITVAPVDVDLV
ncbi:MAG: hypothetical protein ACD_38C00156G0001 [uncultured bacterium]|nr:MAG: hypothetical protein ACD_38C00156G0001 [uncultured bacterium]